MIYSSQFLNYVATSKFVDNLRKGTIVIDNSEYSTWSSCFPMGLYNGALKRVGARSRSPLAFGGAVHAGLESFFRGEADYMAKALADAAVTGLDNLGDPKRNTDKLCSVLAAYTLEYSRRQDLQFKVLQMDGHPAVEQSFMVPLGTIRMSGLPGLFGLASVEQEITILWSGKLDLLTMFEGALAPVDHKTTSIMGPQFADDKVRSNQFLGYTFAAKYLSHQLFNDAPVFGVRVNALAMRQSGYEFKVFDLPFADWKLAEWQSETITAIRTLVRQLDHFLQTREAHPTREHCVTKYGKCPYFDVCDTIPSMRDRMIFDDNYYFVSDWSPLNN